MSLSLESESIPQSFVEIHSSPLSATIRKTIFVATDLLWLRRMFDISINMMTGFAFPKLPAAGGSPTNKACVVMVTVVWEGLLFKYSLRRLHDMNEVFSCLGATCQKFRRLDLGNECRLCVPVRLSQEDLALFGAGAVQKSSPHSILVEANGYFYKCPLWRDDVASLRYVALQLSINTGKKEVPIICPVQYNVSSTQVSFRYARVLFDPMNIGEVVRCLLAYFTSVCDAVDAVHRLGIAHMDIRTENICFDAAFRPVLIDVDRAEDSSTLGTRFRACESCMYNPEVTCAENDWLQVGWMMAWALTGGTSYHTQDFENLPSELKSTEALRILIIDGKFSRPCSLPVILCTYTGPWNSLLPRLYSRPSQHPVLTCTQHSYSA